MLRKEAKKMISTKGRYALRVMLDLVENAQNGPVPLKDIAERQEISKKYLEILVRDLVKGKMIKGSSGKGGGYMLCRAPESYNVGEIIEQMEGPLNTVACLAEEAAECPRAGHCLTLPLWREYDQLVHDFFYQKKLTDLLAQTKH